MYIENYKCVTTPLFKKQVFSSPEKLSTNVNQMECCSYNNKYMQISDEHLLCEDFGNNCNCAQNETFIHTYLSEKTHTKPTLSEALKTNVDDTLSGGFSGYYTIDRITPSIKRINWINVSDLTKSVKSPLYRGIRLLHKLYQKIQMIFVNTTIYKLLYNRIWRKRCYLWLVGGLNCAINKCMFYNF